MANTTNAPADLGLEYGYAIAEAAVIILVGCVVIGIIEHFTRSLLKKHSSQTGRVIRVLSVSLKTLTGIIAFLGVLAVLKIDLTGILTGLGLTSFALGYALKDAISNLLAGVLIIIYRPYTKDDYIEVSGCKGNVVEINLRYTILNFEGAEFLVPNSLCMTNWLKKQKPEAPAEPSAPAATDQEHGDQDSLDEKNSTDEQTDKGSADA